MMIADRSGMMAGIKLPNGLRRIAYIQTTNNTPSSYTYIDTGITPTQNMKWEIRAAIQSNAQNSSLTGFYGGSSGRFDIGRNGNSDVWQFNRGLSTISEVSFDSGWHILRLDGGANTGYVDGSPVVTLSNSFSINITGTIVLFCRGRGDQDPPIDPGGQDVFVNMLLDYSKIWNENGDLIQHLIAVRDSTVGCMFDLVTGQTFGKQGNGSAFVIGPDI